MHYRTTALPERLLTSNYRYAAFKGGSLLRLDKCIKQPMGLTYAAAPLQPMSSWNV
jgi:hypothetical protein